MFTLAGMAVQLRRNTQGTQVALHDKDHPVFKLLNVTARSAGPVLDICDGVVSLALESEWDGEWTA